MKIKLSILIPIFIIGIIAAISYFFLLPTSLYRNDCKKPLEGFDVLFVYIQDCSHCKNDLKRIEKLNISEKFYMIDAGSADCKKVIEDYKDFIVYHKNSNYQNAPPGILTPTKVCLHDNKTHVGEQNETELLKFYEDCLKVKP